MFSYIWFTPLLLFFKNKDPQIVLAQLLPLTVLLSQGHKYAPHLLLLLSQETRAHVLKKRPNILFEILLLIFLPGVLAIAAGCIFYFFNSAKIFYAPIGLLALVYTCWTYFHFSQQNYGVAKIYRMINFKNQNSTFDKVEHLIVTALIFFVTAVICTMSNERLGFYLFFFEPLQMPSQLKFYSAIFCALLYMIILSFYTYKNSMNVGTFLSVTNYFMIPFIICTQPLYLGLLLTAVSHWTQSIYLSSVQIFNDNKYVMKNKFGLWIVLTFFLIVSSIMYAFYNAVFLKLPLYGHFGEAIDLSLYNKNLVFTGLVYFGLNIRVNYTHFYLDRFIYLNNPFIKKIARSNA